MTARSNRAEVRNPLLALPSMRRLQSLDPESRAALRALLLDLRADARSRADKCWRTRKPPLAAYWAAVAVYAGHIARALTKPSRFG
ncbi:MAG: hypothetical protein H2055_04395 [Sphingopyxis sp.]|nr:hypothetical protein [Sphingopyxis sp.]